MIRIASIIILVAFGFAGSYVLFLPHSVKFDFKGIEEAKPKQNITATNQKTTKNNDFSNPRGFKQQYTSVEESSTEEKLMSLVTEQDQITNNDQLNDVYRATNQHYSICQTESSNEKEQTTSIEESTTEQNYKDSKTERPQIDINDIDQEMNRYYSKFSIQSSETTEPTEVLEADTEEGYYDDVNNYIYRELDPYSSTFFTQNSEIQKQSSNFEETTTEQNRIDSETEREDIINSDYVDDIIRRNQIQSVIEKSASFEETTTEQNDLDSATESEYILDNDYIDETILGLVLNNTNNLMRKSEGFDEATIQQNHLNSATEDILDNYDIILRNYLDSETEPEDILYNYDICDIEKNHKNLETEQEDILDSNYIDDMIGTTNDRKQDSIIKQSASLEEATPKQNNKDLETEPKDILDGNVIDDMLQKRIERYNYRNRIQDSKIEQFDILEEATIEQNHKDLKIEPEDYLDSNIDDIIGTIIEQNNSDNQIKDSIIEQSPSHEEATFKQNNQGLETEPEDILDSNEIDDIIQKIIERHNSNNPTQGSVEEQSATFEEISTEQNNFDSETEPEDILDNYDIDDIIRKNQTQDSVIEQSASLEEGTTEQNNFDSETELEDILDNYDIDDIIRKNQTQDSNIEQSASLEEATTEQDYIDLETGPKDILDGNAIDDMLQKIIERYNYRNRIQDSKIEQFTILEEATIEQNHIDLESEPEDYLDSNDIDDIIGTIIERHNSDNQIKDSIIEQSTSHEEATLKQNNQGLETEPEDILDSNEIDDIIQKIIERHNSNNPTQGSVEEQSATFEEISTEQNNFDSETEPEDILDNYDIDDIIRKNQTQDSVIEQSASLEEATTEQNYIDSKTESGYILPSDDIYSIIRRINLYNSNHPIQDSLEKSSTKELSTINTADSSSTYLKKSSVVNEPSTGSDESVILKDVPRLSYPGYFYYLEECSSKSHFNFRIGSEKEDNEYLECFQGRLGVKRCPPTTYYDKYREGCFGAPSTPSNVFEDNIYNI